MLLYIRDACKYQLSYNFFFLRMQTYSLKEKETLKTLNFIITFLTYWKSFQILGEELFIIRHGLLYLWNKLYLGVKCRFVLWVVLSFYVELQILCALNDTDKYRAPPSDQAHELSRASLWHLKYLYAVPLWERRKCTTAHNFWRDILSKTQRCVAITEYVYSLQECHLNKNYHLFYFGSVHLKFVHRWILII